MWLYVLLLFLVITLEKVSAESRCDKFTQLVTTIGADLRMSCHSLIDSEILAMEKTNFTIEAEELNSCRDELRITCETARDSTCGRLNLNIAHGQLSDELTDGGRHVIVATCQRGYNLIGPLAVTCDVVTGHWSIPLCVKSQQDSLFQLLDVKSEVCTTSACRESATITCNDMLDEEIEPCEDLYAFSNGRDRFRDSYNLFRYSPFRHYGPLNFNHLIMTSSFRLPPKLPHYAANLPQFVDACVAERSVYQMLNIHGQKEIDEAVKVINGNKISELVYYSLWSLTMWPFWIRKTFEEFAIGELQFSYVTGEDTPEIFLADLEKSTALKFMKKKFENMDMQLILQFAGDVFKNSIKCNVTEICIERPQSKSFHLFKGFKQAFIGLCKNESTIKHVYTGLFRMNFNRTSPSSDAINSEDGDFTSLAHTMLLLRLFGLERRISYHGQLFFPNCAETVFVQTYYASTMLRTYMLHAQSNHRSGDQFLQEMNRNLRTTLENVMPQFEKILAKSPLLTSLGKTLIFESNVTGDNSQIWDEKGGPYSEYVGDKTGSAYNFQPELFGPAVAVPFYKDTQKLWSASQLAELHPTRYTFEYFLFDYVSIYGGRLDGFFQKKYLLAMVINYKMLPTNLRSFGEIGIGHELGHAAEGVAVKNPYIKNENITRLDKVIQGQECTGDAYDRIMEPRVTYKAFGDYWGNTTLGNGERSGEALADAFGINVAYTIFQSIERVQALPLGYTAEQHMWMQPFHEHSLLYENSYHPPYYWHGGRHPPDAYRTMIPASSHPGYQEAFKCNAGDAMYKKTQCWFFQP